MNADAKGGGFDSDGAETVFARLVDLGVLRPVTAEQFRTIGIVHARTRSAIKVRQQSDWYEVVPDVLARLYPRGPR
ncbi:hypothetical protein GCM10025867_30090 [Frondihabitans sucicola]|uniref:Uncharacterized protein n=1 Tax=Frondihabitans sucicola TaxID=1268041 RepID=A0ABM8GQM3_9MICO|nr:hypothetical protein [Frondihabitans sucicola]BDZ50768.1 hypothetical protein GCM10025867_30090 [Frondihabitans sucicola]